MKLSQRGESLGRVDEQFAHIQKDYVWNHELVRQPLVGDQRDVDDVETGLLIPPLLVLFF